MKRDQKGRFTKEDYSNDSYEFKFALPTLKSFIFIILLILSEIKEHDIMVDAFPNIIYKYNEQYQQIIQKQ